MKKLLITLVSLLALVSSYSVFAEHDPSLAAKVEACFRAHAHLMDKPALKNERACWRVHAYLMESR